MLDINGTIRAALYGTESTVLENPVDVVMTVFISFAEYVVLKLDSHVNPLIWSSPNTSFKFTVLP